MTDQTADHPPELAPDETYKGDTYAWFVVAIFCLITVAGFIDRQIINLLVEPIKADLALSDTQMSLLQGFAFAMFYAVLALPIARLADSANRKWVIAVGILFWTAATALCGLAQKFWQLFIARMFIGVGEATLAPAGMSMLADYFPKDKAGLAISILTGAGFVGTGIALVVGGMLIDWITVLGPQTWPVVGTLQPWQITFMAVGLPGMLLFFMMFLVAEPPRRAAPGSTDEASIRETLRFVGRNIRLVLCLFGGFAFLAAAQYGYGAWIPTLFNRLHGMSPGEIGFLYGILVSIFGTAGVVSGGWLAGVLLRKGRQDAHLLIGILAAAGAIPLGILFPLTGDPTLSLIVLAPLTFFGTLPFGPGPAAIPIISPPRMRAQMVAIYLLIANFFGLALGPWAIAATTDFVFGAEQAIGQSMALAPPLLYILGTTVLLFALKPFKAAMAAAR